MKKRIKLTLKEKSFTKMMSDQINNYQLETGVLIPPLFKIFLTHFFLEKGSELEEYFKLSSFDKPFQLIWQDYDGDSSENGFEEFFFPKDFSTYMEQVYNDPELDAGVTEDKILIGISVDTFLLLGIGSENQDCIYLDDMENEPRLTLLSSNIFDYLSNLKLIFSLEVKRMDVDVQNLYKNWGEDFWRVREDK